MNTATVPPTVPATGGVVGPSASISGPRCASTEGIFLILCFLGWLFTVMLPDLLSLKLPIIPLEAPLGYLLGDHFLVHATTATSWSESFRLDLEQHVTSSHTRRTTVETVTSEAHRKNRSKGEEVVLLAGLVKDTAKIQNRTWELLRDLSCHYNVTIHIATEIVANSTQAHTQGQFCAPIRMQNQAHLPSRVRSRDNEATTQANSNWIERNIAHMRDVQRDEIRDQLFALDSNKTSLEEADSYVIVLDLDLWEVPGASDIMARVSHLGNDDSRKDSVICGAAGNGLNQPQHDDTSALVFWPDTWAMPLEERLIPHHYPGEDPSMIRVALKTLRNNSSAFSRYDWIQDYIQQQAAQHEDNLLPVRSCFGGIAVTEPQFGCPSNVDTACHFWGATTIEHEKQGTVSRAPSYMNQKGTPTVLTNIRFNDMQRDTTAILPSTSCCTSVCRERLSLKNTTAAAAAAEWLLIHNS